MPSAATTNGAAIRPRRSTRFEPRGLTNRDSPFSPAFLPIQNVPAAPTSEPIVASIAYSQNSSGFRAVMMMTTKSIPSGRKNTIEASSMPMRTMPTGVRK